MGFGIIGNGSTPKNLVKRNNFFATGNGNLAIVIILNRTADTVLDCPNRRFIADDRNRAIGIQLALT